MWKIGASVQNLQVFSSAAYVNRKGLLLTEKPNSDQEDIESAGEGLEFDVGIQVANGEPIRSIGCEPWETNSRAVSSDLEIAHKGAQQLCFRSRKR